MTLSLSENSLKILERRYLAKNEKRELIETPEEMFRRVARNIASAEALYGGDVATMENEFYEIMTSLKFLPNSPTLMNAGKPELQQLSACFVLPIDDSIGSIFDAVKYTALIHKSGGGCVAKGTRIFTTFCGLENIENIYEHFSKTSIPKTIKNAEIIDISKEGIQTLSFEKKSGKIELKPILKVWKYQIDESETIKITTEGNSEIVTSNWHPFFIWNGGKVVERRADEIRTGDFLIISNGSIFEQWPFLEYHSIGDFPLDESFAYFFGLFQTDGALGKFRNSKTGWTGLRLRFFTLDNKLLEIYLNILEDLTAKRYSPQVDPRTEVKFVTCYDRRLNEAIKDLNRGIIGKKSKRIRIPEQIYKSPVSVIGSYLAALIDGDGHVMKSKKEVQISSGSKYFAEDLNCLLSVFGIKPRFRLREDKRSKKKSITYETSISGFEDFKKLADLVLPYLNCEEKKRRIEKYLETTHSSVPCQLDFNIFEPILNEVGIDTNTTAFWRKSIQIGTKKFFLARWREKNRINTNKVITLVKELLSYFEDILDKEDKIYLQMLLRVLPSLVRVKDVHKGDTTEFYDFTVEKTNNYLAGNGALFIVHNTGFSFSRLRPKNDIVKTTGGIASGPISFMKVLNTSTEVIKQGGRRRGANMGILRVDHPDIIEFITSKGDLTELTNFNISVAATDEFMKAAKTDRKYDLISPRTRQVVETLDAKNVFDLIVEMAWKNGEPGLFFIDRANQFNPTPALGDYESTNPCGEQLLLGFESCNLGSINLAKMVKHENGQYVIDYEEMKRVVRLSVRFLDNVIDMNNFPLPEIEKMTKENRKIGLGVMGWADLLIELKIPYDSLEALELAEKIMKIITEEGRKASEDLAKERIAFPNFEDSIYKDSTPLRNATITTIAPTGTISMIADCSSGIEPLFAVSYFKKVMDGEKLVTVNSYFERTAKEEGIYNQELMQKIAEQGTIQKIDEIPEHIRRIFVTAHDISPEWHVRMQAAFQKYTHNAVSKTVNMPQDATKGDVATVFMTAYDLGCKGVTVFRYGSREAVVNIGKVEVEETPKEDVLTPRTRPSVTVGETERIRTGCGNLYVTINADNEGLFEVFSTLGHAGGCPSAQSEAISRLISLSLRSGVKIESVIKQLAEIRCPSASWDEGTLILSCPDAIGKALSRYIERHGIEDSDEKPAIKSYFGICPDCGGQLVHEEGCLICKSCGASKCE